MSSLLADIIRYNRSQFIDHILYDTIVTDLKRNSFSAGSLDYDPQAWWYASGYADAMSGYGHGKIGHGTVNYSGASYDAKSAYDQGWEDGYGDLKSVLFESKSCA